MLCIDKRQNRTREQLREIPIIYPKRAQSDRWMGIQHGMLADTIISSAEDRGLLILEEAWGVSNDNMAMYGSVTFDTPHHKLPFAGSYALAVRHSNNCEFALTFGIGAKVFICSNGLLIGRFIAKKRHRDTLDVPYEVSVALDALEPKQIEVEKFYFYLKTAHMDRFESSDLTMQLARRKIVPWNYIRYIDEAYHRPQHDEFREPTKWAYYNAITEAIKRAPPNDQMTILADVRDFISEGRWTD